MKRIALPVDWTLAATASEAEIPENVADRTIPATVPGCVHTDLMAADLLADPYIGMNEHDQLWIGSTDWRYSCTFDLADNDLAEDRLDLVCEGLDTLATVTLNGRVIGESEDMHVRQRFDARAAAQAGHNELVIDFKAPVPFAKANQEKYNFLPYAGNTQLGKKMPHNMIRKMACNFGWDWGPALPTAGVWRPIYFEAWSGVRFGDVQPLVMSVSDTAAEVELRIATETANDTHAGQPIDLGYSFRDPQGNRAVCEPLYDAKAGELVTAKVTIPNPQRWWPVGHGEQPLYELKIKLKDAERNTVQETVHQVGLRTCELATDPDPEPVEGFGQGEGMVLKVNGKPIYLKGANWIPDDCFPHRVGPDRFRARIEQARDANMNMLRVWGGGLYEDNAFYEICDELGVLVWQDFLFACACYPEDDYFQTLAKAELDDNLPRLARHACIVLWNGCNENLWGITDWREYRDQAEGKVWGHRYYVEWFPEWVAALDPSRPYWPGSPYSGEPDIYARNANLNEYGNRHIWDVWHGPGKYRNYLSHYPRLSSEFGFHGPATWPTIERSIPEDQRSWNSECMKLHNKNEAPGQEQTNRRMADDFVPPTDDFDDWLYLAQIMQARALEMGVTWFRSMFPWNTGALYWQLNDCYPVSSWSAIDGGGRKKPLLDASRRFFADRLITIKPPAPVELDAPIPELDAALHNDHDGAWSGTLRVRKMRLDGEVVDTFEAAIDVAPRSLARHRLPASFCEDTDQCFLVAEQVGAPAISRGYWWFQPDHAMHYPAANFDLTLDGETLTVTARTLVRDLCIFVDRVDPMATISDQALTLLPGDTVQLQVQSNTPLDAVALQQPKVCQTANGFGAK